MNLKQQVIAVSSCFWLCLFGVESVNFDEFCNDSLKCDAGAFLKCSGSSTCECENTETMIYTPEKGSCVAKVGERCQPQATNSSGDAVGSKAMTFPSCTSNSSCGSDLICSCDVGFSATGNGLCMRRKNFSEPCTEDDECQYEGAFLTCVNGKCGCNATISVYNEYKSQFVNGTEEVEVDGYRYGSVTGYMVKGDSDRVVNGDWVRGDPRNNRGVLLVRFENRIVSEPLGQCVGLAGKECNADSNCVYNSSCVSGICTCHSNFTLNADGRCGAENGMKFTSVTPCADGLSYVGSVCKCEQGRRQYYNKDAKKCLGFPATFCSEDGDCIKNAICTLNPTSGKKQCACARGFSETKRDENINAYTSSCKRRPGLGEECDSSESAVRCTEGLECVNRRCACEDSSTVFDDNFRECFGMIGAKCGNLNWEYNYSTLPRCVEGATCFQPNSGYFGRCICKEGYKSTSDGLCQKLQRNF